MIGEICPGCERCEGAAHHWVTGTDGEGLPIWGCKHCPAQIDIDELCGDLEPELEEDGLGTSVCYVDPGRRGRSALVVVHTEAGQHHAETIELRESRIVEVSKRYL